MKTSFDITPLKSDGTKAAGAADGYFTLASGTTYLLPLSGDQDPFVSCHVQWDATIVITSITVEDSNMDRDLVSDYSTTAGDWIDEDPSTAFVGTVGAGASVSNGVVANTGGAAGGAMFLISDTAAARTRLKVVVGATGGTIRACGNRKR